MNFKKELGRLVANINTGFVNKTIEIKHNYNKNLEKVLYLMVKEGLIHGFKIKKENKLFLIYLKFDKNHSQNTKIILKSKVSNPKFIKGYKIESLQYKDTSSLFITSTNKGLINNTKNHIKGGEFLFQIKL